MNLFLRLLIHLAKTPFQQRIGLLDECISRFRVWFTDQDAFRHVTNSRYFSLTDISIISYMMRTRAWRTLSKRGWIPMVAYEDMAFRKMMRAPHKFIIRTRMLGWTDEYVVLRHAFERRDKTIAEGLTVARFIDKNREVVPPPTVAALVGFEGEPTPLPAFARDAIARAQNPHELDGEAAEEA